MPPFDGLWKLSCGKPAEGGAASEGYLIGCDYNTSQPESHRCALQNLEHG